MTPTRTATASLLLGLAATMAGCGDGGAAGPGVALADGPGPAAPAMPKVEVVPPELATVRRTTEQPGQVEAYEVTPLHARLAGLVRKLSADIGDHVKKGQILAELWAPEVEAEVGRKKAQAEQARADEGLARVAVDVARAAVLTAEARQAEAQAGIRRADAEAARWDAELARVSQLVRESALTGTLLDETRNKQLAAQAGRDEARSHAKTAEAAVAEAKAGVEKARADLASASANVEVARFGLEHAEALASFRKIEAPYDGIVTRRNVETGQLTRVGAEGPPLFVVTRSDLVTVTVGVPEASAPWVDAGDAAKVRVQALGNRIFEGKVARTSWSLDAATRTLAVEIDLQSKYGLLRPGLYAYVTIIEEEHTDAMTLPLSALIREGDKSFCATVVDGKIVRREVSVGITDGARAEIAVGLDGGEDVVKVNSPSLTDGLAVEVVRPADAGAKPAKL